MQFSTAALLSALLSLAAAQSATDLPQCSLPCFIQNVPSTGCGLQDYACQCTQQHQDQIRQPITSCVMKQCTNQQDQIKTLQVTQAICKKYGSSSSSGGGMSMGSGMGMGGNSTGGGSGGMGGMSGGSSTSSGGGLPSRTGPVPTAFTAGASVDQVARGGLVGGVLAGLVGMLVA